MTTIQPISITNTNNFINVISKLGDKSVSIINALKVNTPKALVAVKDTAVYVALAASAALKALAMNTYHYLSIGFVKVISAIDITVKSVAAALGPHYPIVAVSVISFAIGAGLLYASQDKN